MPIAKVPKTKSEWRKKLTPEQYRILREKGTEAPFSGKYDTFFDSGSYKCAACGNILFTSETKYDSGCGWPAFFAANEKSIVTEEDSSHGMHRVEVMCKTCGGHLGHVFDDGPKDKGGKRLQVGFLTELPLKLLNKPFKVLLVD